MSMYWNYRILQRSRVHYTRIRLNYGRPSAGSWFQYRTIRLLKSDGNGNFGFTKDLVGSGIPEYAILSHTWGPDSEEVTLQDLVDGSSKGKIGYDKIRFCADQAQRHGLRHFWIDTCCIDKTNNAELAEAINSMFSWYRNAARCYVYLSDVSIAGYGQGGQPSSQPWESDFRASRWFTRGWTLQELLAPKSVQFFAQDGILLGDKTSLLQQIHEITGIAIPALCGDPLSCFEVEERFKWAENRQTTREEDWAYSLLGIFSVFIPPIYGEGKTNAVRRLRKEIGDSFHQLLERQETPPKPVANIPFSRDPDFVDRGDILNQIDKRCSEPAARVALVGLGGVGKSQLAIEYAHRVAAGQPETWVFWVHAGTQARVEEGFRMIADAVKLPGRNQPKADILQLVYSWLSNERNGRWVTILDSADDRDVFYNANDIHGSTNGDARDRPPFVTYLPQSRNGSILVTTRNNDLAFRLTGRRQNMIEVGPMAQADALTLLERKLGSLPDTTVAIDLVQALDLVPLAISQAVAYIQARAPRSSPEKYLVEFWESERKRSRLLAYDSGDLRRDGGASNAILTAWTISFDHIRSKRQSAADLLSLMSFFDRQGIPGWVLKPSRTTEDTTQARCPDEAGERKSDDGSSATDSGADDGTDDDIDGGFEDDVAILRDYCLITADEEGDEFKMHGLVQLSTRKWLEATGQQETFKQQYIRQMAASFPAGIYENWATCRSLFAHVQVALGYRPSEETVETWATLLHNGGWYAWSQGRYDIAHQMAGKSRKAREKRLGKKDVATLDSMSLLAMVLWNQGRWEEAEKLEVYVMETLKTKLGVDHPDTLASMGNLAATYENQGRWEEAEELFVQVIGTSKTKLGVDHPNTLTSMGNLATIYANQGRWEEAEELFVQVIGTSKTKLGVDHPNTLTSMGNLASTYGKQSRWEEAEKLFVQVMETRKTKLGVDHPDTLTSMGNLALIYGNQGRWGEAEKLEVYVMETLKTKLGVDHPDTLASMGNLAATYENQDRWEEAEELFVQVIGTSKTKLGVDHPDTLTNMGNLASTYANQGRWEEAEELFVEVMGMSKTKLGVDHPDTLTSMNNLAFTWKGQGRHADALALMEDCAQARRRVLGEEHPYTLSSLATVATWSS